MSLGEAFITVRADTSAFKTELAAQVKAILDAQQTTVRVSPTTSGSSDPQAAAAKALSDLQAQILRDDLANIQVEAAAERDAQVIRVAEARAANDAIKQANADLAASNAAGIAELKARYGELAAAEAAAYAEGAAAAKAANDALFASNAAGIADLKARYNELAAAEVAAYAEGAAAAKAIEDALFASNAAGIAELKARYGELAAAEAAAYAEGAAAAKAANDAIKASNATLAASNAAGIAELKARYGELAAAEAAAYAENAVRSRAATAAAKAEEDSIGGLGNALGDLFTKSRNAGSAIENIVNVFKELPLPAQIGVLVAAAGAIEAAFVTAITAVSAAADAALAKIGLTAAGSIEDVRNELSAAFGVNVGQQLSDSLLQISTSSGIAEAALGGVVVQLQGLGLSAPQATGVLNAFVAAVDAAGLHGQGAATAIGALEKAFGSAAASSKFTTTSIKSFSDLLPSLSKTAIVAQLVADGVGKNAAAVDRLLAAGKVTTTQGLTAVQLVAAKAPQTGGQSVGGIVDTTKNAISNALGAAFDNKDTLAKIQGLATTIQKALSDPKFTAELTKGFGDFADFLQKVLPKAFDLFQKGTAEADAFIKRFGPDIVGLIGDIDGAFTAITTKGTPANDVLQGFEATVGGIVGIVQFFKPLLDALGNAFGAAGIEIKLASDILRGNFSGAIHDAEDALKDIANVALDAFKQIDDIVIASLQVLLKVVSEAVGAFNAIPLVPNIPIGPINDAIGLLGSVKSAVDDIPSLKNVDITVNTAQASAALSALDSQIAALFATTGSGAAGDSAANADTITGILNGQGFFSPGTGPGAAAAAATSGSKSGSSSGATAAQTAAKTLATAAATFKTALAGFTTAIGGAQTVAAVDAAFKTLQSAIDTEDKALGKAEPTGLVTYLAKQKAALDKAASEVELGLSERASFLAQASVAAANPNVAGISGILNQLQGTLARTTEFAKDVKKLQAEGLNQTAIQQLLAVGPTAAGLQAANDLIQASAAQIGQINSVQTQIGQQGENLGTTLAANFKSAGVQAAAGLIDGLRSALPALEKQMTTLASAMDKQIKKDLGIHSPSTLFAAHGANIVAGLAKGINDSAVPSVPTPTLGKLGLGHGSTDNSVTFGPGSIVVNGGNNPKETGSAIGSAIVDVLLARRLSSALAS